MPTPPTPPPPPQLLLLLLSSTGSINTILNWFLELTFQQLIKFIYQLSCFSFKFYLMYQFILYELSINQIGFKNLLIIKNFIQS